MTRTDVRTTPQFRSEAGKVILEQGLLLKAAAQRLLVPKGTLANWVKAARRRSTTPTFGRCLVLICPLHAATLQS
jgi:transposase